MIRLLAAVRPEADDINTAARGFLQWHIPIVEDQGIATLPNIPSDRSADCSLLEGAAASLPEFLHRTDLRPHNRGVEESPHFLSPRAPNKKVVSVFNCRTRGTIRGGTQLMTKAVIVCREALATDQPIEDSAFEGSHIAPHLTCQIVSLKHAKIIGIEDSVREGLA